MTQRIALLSLVTLLTLAACSKPPAAPPSDDDEDSGKSPSSAAKVEHQQPHMDRAVKAAGMMQLIDPAPQCQQYRDQLEQAGKVPADQPLPVEMSKIVAQANDAGCVIKRKK